MTVPVLGMGRRRLFGVFAVCSLTLLNIWMAKYVVRPFNEAERLLQVDTVTDQRLLDVLVVSVDDMHPLQHLQNAAALEEKKHVPTSTISSLQVTSGTAYATYPNNIHQAGHLADINNVNYGIGELVDKQLNGHFENPENRIDVRDVNPENSLVGGNVKLGNNMAAENDNSWANNNINVINGNEGNIFDPYRNADTASYLQHTNGNTYEHQPAGLNKQIDELQAPKADIWNHHLKSVDTGELLNIKNSLETLKHLLGKFRPDSRRSVLDRLVRDEALKTYQPSVESRIATVGDDNVKELSSNQSHSQTQSEANPLEFYQLGSFKSGLNPPQMAAQVEPAQIDVKLLIRLLNETNSDHLNLIVNENTDAVKNLLSQILQHLQHRQQELEYQQQQQKSGFFRSGQSESGVRGTYVNGPVISLDYNKNAIKEMIKNIATYNQMDSSIDNDNVVHSFLRDLQAGHL